MRRFFSTAIHSDHIALDAEESRHLSKVLRMQVGDRLEVVDGKGGLYQCKIIEIGKKACRLEILESQRSKPESELWMAVAPTKNINRWEWFLEKATEIGIGRISPILCEHSERKALKMDRQERILKEAMKQSQRMYLPQLDELRSFDELIEEGRSSEVEKYIAHCEEEAKEMLLSLHQKGNKALILIGPEGDFSPKEIQLAAEDGFKPISLGRSRLRTETAALVACHTINLIDA